MVEKVEIVITARDKASATLQGIGKVAGRVVKTVGAIVLATAAATGALAIKAINQAGDAEEMMSKLQATFGGASESLIDDLDAFAAATGRSSFALRSQATDLGAVLKALGFTSKASADLSAITTKLAVDIGSFNNLPSEDVANRITRAYTGEFESLKALGIVINQAKLSQELMNMGIEGGTKAATDQQKVMAVNAIILRQTADAQGDAERTAGSFTNQMIALKSTISDVVTELGLKLLPVVTPFIQRISELARVHLPQLLEKLGPLIQKFSEFSDLLLAGDLRSALATFIPRETVDAIIDFSQALGAFITEKLVPFIKDHGKGLIAIFKGIAAAVGSAIIISSITAIGASIAALSAPVLAVIAAIGLLVTIWNADWKKIGDVFKRAWRGIINTFNKAIDFIKSLFTVEFWVELGTNIIDGIIEGIQRAIAGLLSIFTWLGGVVSAAGKKAFKIGSPSGLGEDWGESIDEGMGVGIRKNVGKASGAIKSTVPKLAGAAIGAGGGGFIGGGGGGNIIINFMHSPTISLASAAEFEEKIAPLLGKIIRANIGHRRAQ